LESLILFIFLEGENSWSFRGFFDWVELDEGEEGEAGDKEFVELLSVSEFC
jgi:hypothetical protein